MAYTISTKSKSDIQADLVSQLISTTPLTDVSVGSTIGGIITGAANEVSRVRDDLNTAFGATYVNSAAGFYLDLKAADRNLSRKITLSTNIACTEKVVAIRTKDGSPIMSSLATTSGNYRIIGTGYSVGSSRNLQVKLTTNETCYFTSSDSITYIGVTGSLGDKQVLPPGTLDIFEWAACPVFIGANLDNLELVQKGTITGVQQVESDASLRYRIKSLPTAMATANETAIVNSALINPEVAYVSIVRNVRGTGSANIVAVPVNRRISYAAITQLQNDIDAIKSYGEDIVVKSPAYVPVLMTIRVAASSLIPIVNTVIRNGFLRLGLGASMSYGVINQWLSDANVIGASIVELIVDGRAILASGSVNTTTEELLELDVPVSYTARYSDPIVYKVG